jgi:putative ABC transport system permease protein
MGFLDDLRYGLRGLAQNRGFTAVAVLSLALGIGANTTIFTLLNAIFLRPLPVRDAAHLAAVYTTDPRIPGLLFCSYPNYLDYRDHNAVFSSVLAYSALTLNLTGRGDPRLLMGQLVTANYFSTLGVDPVVGRGFRGEEDVVGAAPVVVISHDLWRRLFQGNRDVVRQTIEISGHPYSIIGVAPEGFAGVNQLNGADVFLPFSAYPRVYPYPGLVTQRRALLFAAVGRLKPGVSLPQAEAAMQSLAQGLEGQYPRENQGRRIRLTTLHEAAVNAHMRPVVSQSGLVLMTVSGLVLLIACANVANLLLARATGRHREMAIRLALGASRGRLIRQLLTESVVLALAGGAGGMLVARWSRDLLWSWRPPMFKHAAFRLDLDPRVLLFTAGIALAAGVLFGLVPALRATRANLATDLNERAGAPGGFQRLWHPRAILVMAQVAFSLVALIGAALFVRSLRNAGQMDAGFDAPHLGVVAYNVTDQGYNEGRGRDFHLRSVEQAAAVPGVVSAALGRDGPFHVASARMVLLEGEASTGAGQGRSTLTSVVTPGYFRTLGIALERGRDFQAADSKTSPRVAIVNETAARAYWPGQDAIGQHISFAGEGLPVEVIGIVKTANYLAIAEPPQPLVYLSLAQYYFPTAVLYVRTAGDPDAVMGAVRRRVQALDGNLLLQVETVQTSIRELLWAQRLSAGLLAVFGGLALGLATIGIYGVISYSVRQRTREIGVRLALGATVGDIHRMILREGLRLVAIGVVAGAAVSLAAAGRVGGLLFLDSPRDGLTFTLVPALLAVVGVVACWIPSIRATNIDPSVALRNE